MDTPKPWTVHNCNNMPETKYTRSGRDEEIVGSEKNVVLGLSKGIS